MLLYEYDLDHSRSLMLALLHLLALGTRTQVPIVVFLRAPFDAQWIATVPTAVDPSTGISPSQWLSVTPTRGNLTSKYICGGAAAASTCSISTREDGVDLAEVSQVTWRGPPRVRSAR